jgi:hypothetical protein
VRVEDFISHLGYRRWLFHFTDIANLPLIRQHGLLSYAELMARGIDPPKPGGNDWSREVDQSRGLDHYVHLCLMDSHPMEFVAKRDGHIGPTRFLRVSTDILRTEGVVGCEKVANGGDAIVRPLTDALDHIDIDVLFDSHVDFYDPPQRDRYNAAKKAEIMVPRHIPVDYILNLG